MRDGGAARFSPLGGAALLTVEEVAELLRLPTDSAGRRQRTADWLRREIPSVRVRRGLRVWRLDRVIEWLDQHEEGAEAAMEERRWRRRGS